MNRESQFFAYVFFTYLYKYDVCPDLNNTLPWDHIFTVSSEKPAQLAGAGNDQRLNGSILGIQFQITDAPERPAGANVDDFLLTQGTESDRITGKGKRFLHGETSFLQSICNYLELLFV